MSSGERDDHDIGGFQPRPSWSPTPVPINVGGFDSNVDPIGIGRGFACVMNGEGDVTCWGHNTFGQLGDGTTTDHDTPSSRVAGIHGALVLAVGYWHACVITKEYTVRCWGHNANGELGDGTTVDRSTPVTTLQSTN